jgi:hypothetical protein
MISIRILSQEGLKWVLFDVEDRDVNTKFLEDTGAGTRDFSA